MCEQILQTQDLGGGKNLVQFLSVNSMANHFHIFWDCPKYIWHNLARSSSRNWKDNKVWLFIHYIIFRENTKNCFRQG